MRAWRLLPLLAAFAAAQEGEGVAGKGEALLLKQIADPDADVRARAARALGRADGEGAVDALRAALKDDEGKVRVAAAVALARLGASDRAAIDVLAGALGSPDWYTRWDACVALGALGPLASDAAPALLAAAAAPELDLARDAVIALMRVAPDDPQVHDGLVRLLRGDAAIDRAVLLRALDGAGRIEVARDWLAAELVSNRHGLRATAAKLLPKCGVTGLRYLQETLKSDDPYARAMAIHHLERQDRVGAAVFVDVLSDPELRIRCAALEALVRRRAVFAGPRIADLLGDGEREVRLAAAKALARLEAPVPEAGPGLVRLVAEGDAEATAIGLAAMRAAGFAALAAFVEVKVEGDAPDKRVPRMRLLPRGSSDEFDQRLERLVASLEDNRNGAALVAALRETLASGEDAILIAGLEEKDPALRRAAAQLLGLLAQEREPCVRALEKAAKDRDPDVRAAAEQALARLRP